MLTSKMKTWLKRNGFKGEGKPRTPMRECSGYVVRSGRRFRVRESAGVVDIGEPYATFDKWANSTERTVPIAMFKKEFARNGNAAE